LKFIHAVKNDLRIIWSEHTAHAYKHHEKTRSIKYALMPTINALKKYNLNDSISRTGFGAGRSMKREFVKNCSLLLASIFLGTFAAESLIVKSKYNLLICVFCISSKVK